MSGKGIFPFSVLFFSPFFVCQDSGFVLFLDLTAKPQRGLGLLTALVACYGANIFSLSSHSHRNSLVGSEALANANVSLISRPQPSSQSSR